MAEYGPDNPIIADVSDLTMRELDAIEHALGEGMDVLFGTGKPKARVMAAVAWAVARRTDPEVALNDIMDLPMNSIKVTTDEEAPGEG